MPWRWGRAHLCSPAFTLGPGGGCSELALAYLWLNLPSPVVPTAWFQVSAHTASVLEGVVRPGTRAPGGGGLSTPQGHRPPSLCSPAIVCSQELYSWCPAFHSKRRGPKVKRESWAAGPLGMLDPWLCCSLVERAHRQCLHSRGPGPSPRCCDLLLSVRGLVLLSALWILHGKGGKPPRSLRVPSLEVFLSC